METHFGAEPAPEQALTARNGTSEVEIEIRPIQIHEVMPLRREVLRITGQRLNFEEDSMDSVIHLGAHVNDDIVGIVTLFKKEIGNIEGKENPVTHLPVPDGDVQWQLRGFAIATEIQKRGVGQKLLEACVEYVKERGGRFLWCNARVSATMFYAKQGFSFTGDAFHVEEVGMHRYMFRRI